MREEYEDEAREAVWEARESRRHCPDCGLSGGAHTSGCPNTPDPDEDDEDEDEEDDP